MGTVRDSAQWCYSGAASVFSEIASWLGIIPFHSLFFSDFVSTSLSFMINPTLTGCREPMRPHLGPIVDQVTPLLTDAVPRVRSAAAKAIGQMSLDFSAQDPREIPICFETQFHSIVIPALFGCVRASEGHPRVQVRRRTEKKKKVQTRGCVVMDLTARSLT